MQKIICSLHSLYDGLQTYVRTYAMHTLQRAGELKEKYIRAHTRKGKVVNV